MAAAKTKSGRRVLVRSHLAGVFFGTLVGEASSDGVKMIGSRRIYSWTGALSCDTIARIGCAATSRITGPVDQVIYGQIVQVIDLTPEADTILSGIVEAK
jgi:hypothetical protein